MPGKDVPGQNGLPSGKMSFDPDDPDYIRDLQRPAVIKEDLNEMERRKRVNQILESKAFRKELEQLIIDEQKRGTKADNLDALERLRKLILPQANGVGYEVGLIRQRGYPTAQAIKPIADLRGTGDTSKYSKQERLLRTKLACLFRLVDHFRWNQGHANHITFRLSVDSDELLINPDGVPYGQLSAGLMAKVNLQGNVLDRGYYNVENVVVSDFDLHVAVHSARQDLRCVMLLQTPVANAVSAMQFGLLPICQEAMIVGRVSIHECETGLSTVGEDAIARDIGPKNKVMLLRNHGFIVGGQSVEEVFHLAYHVVLACETQVRAARVGLENLCIPSEQAQHRAYETAQGGGGGVNMVAAEKSDGVKWKVGELEWEAWMRVLDNAGQHTGHIYRQPVHKSRAPAAQSDVEVPPAACAYGLLAERTEPDYAGQLQPEPKVRWLNSPNLYQKVEFEESGTSEPKRFTKWVPDAASAGASNPIKITSPHQFTPVSQNPKEFKLKQKAIKEARRADTINAGPQSKILDGVTWEEAAKMKDAATSGTTEMIMIGSASQGIIDPEYRHNAQMYRQLYQPNPFASVTDEEIRDYIKVVERRQGGAVTRGFSALSEPSFDEYSLMEGARGRVGFVDQQRDLTSTVSVSTVPDNSAATLPSRTVTPSATAELSKTVSPKIQASSLGGWFQRSKSDRFGMTKRNGQPTAPDYSYGPESARSAASDEDSQKDGNKMPEIKEKKKRFKTPSFLRSKKDKESKKKADR